MFMTFNKNYMGTICSYMRKSHNKVSIIKRIVLALLTTYRESHIKSYVKNVDLGMFHC